MWDSVMVRSITFNGGPGNDRFTNDTALPMVAYGNAGGDSLFGGNGNDLLAGGTGNDVLVGGLGGDVLFGNSGHDTLYANAIPGTTSGDWLSDGSVDDLDGGNDANDLYSSDTDGDYATDLESDLIEAANGILGALADFAQEYEPAAEDGVDLP
jgi:Ca2+-binding RTX toxin-like protein